MSTKTRFEEEAKGNSEMAYFYRYFHVHSQAYPGYKGIDCSCLRIHKHPDIKKAFDCASLQSYIRQILAKSRYYKE